MSLKKIHPKDRMMLREFFETDYYKIFKKHLLDQQQLDFAQQSAWASNMEQLKFIQGGIAALREIHLELKKLHKEEVDKEAKKNAESG